MRLYKLQTIAAHHQMGNKRCVAGQTVQARARSSESSHPRVRHTQTIWSVSTSNLLIDWETLNGMQAERTSPAMDHQYRATRQLQLPPSHLHSTTAHHFTTPLHLTTPFTHHLPLTSRVCLDDPSLPLTCVSMSPWGSGLLTHGRAGSCILNLTSPHALLHSLGTVV